MQVCGSHALQPSLWATASRITSSDSLRPIQVRPGAEPDSFSGPLAWNSLLSAYSYRRRDRRQRHTATGAIVAELGR